MSKRFGEPEVRPKKKVKKPQTIPAILKWEKEGRALDKTMLRKLLRHYLSIIVRERDNYTCYVTGQRCEPGIIYPGLGQCAHLIPISDLPPEYRYDPRFCKWMETLVHGAFDGKLGRGKKSANQIAVLGKIAKEEPELMELLLNTPKSRNDEAPLWMLREQLAQLRDAVKEHLE